MARINIDISHGSPQGDDIERARDAATAVIEASDATADSAYSAYRSQIDAVNDGEELTGLARVWHDAEQAANVALTSDWLDTDGAHCSISL